jgi:hypothetical protein
MIPGKDATRRSNSLDAELDALVAREVDALALRQPRTNAKLRPTPETAARPPSAVDESAADALEFPAQRPTDAGRVARAKSAASNVIGIRHRGLPGILTFSAEEEAFIEQAVAFLRERDNADVIIEEVWTHTVLDRDEGADRTVEAEALAEESEAPNEAQQGEDSISADDAGTGTGDDDRVMPLKPAATRARARGASRPADAPPAKSPASQPAPPRTRQKPDAAEPGKDEEG